MEMESPLSDGTIAMEAESLSMTLKRSVGSSWTMPSTGSFRTSTIIARPVSPAFLSISTDPRQSNGRALQNRELLRHMAEGPRIHSKGEVDRWPWRSDHTRHVHGSDCAELQDHVPTTVEV